MKFVRQQDTDWELLYDSWAIKNKCLDFKGGTDNSCSLEKNCKDCLIYNYFDQNKTLIPTRILIKSEKISFPMKQILVLIQEDTCFL